MPAVRRPDHRGRALRLHPARRPRGARSRRPALRRAGGGRRLVLGPTAEPADLGRILVAGAPLPAAGSRRERPAGRAGGPRGARLVRAAHTRRGSPHRQAAARRGRAAGSAFHRGPPPRSPRRAHREGQQLRMRRDRPGRCPPRRQRGGDGGRAADPPPNRPLPHRPPPPTCSATPSTTQTPASSWRSPCAQPNKSVCSLVDCCCHGTSVLTGLPSGWRYLLRLRGRVLKTTSQIGGGDAVAEAVVLEVVAHVLLAQALAENSDLGTKWCT